MTMKEDSRQFIISRIARLRAHALTAKSVVARRILTRRANALATVFSVWGAA